MENPNQIFKVGTVTYKSTFVNIADIKFGDIIRERYTGAIKVVCKPDITYDGFMGKCIFGDSYDCGYTPVNKLLVWNGMKFH